ncbi:hypothetical protein CEUSTIGMA_g10359.t1 [Chlamydomonas eustigma]|uniref:MORN repeat-containing protein 5 n=1 Tax=Chlamydomonas eustigma TaxID=1157962 RepID=A0A250XJ42_9CHLO|nr:hypothetical protein CEUSTIGMA_g10359.t1 [Chlamydomonas eustigma]|eukprot:GAX82932.1 hypothetical protein CEUSTIGMA_g10359.t1 [Chlamydomonas eustigma]
MAAVSTAPVDQPMSGNGKFYYPNGGVYHGEWKYLIKEPVTPEQEKKGKKPSKDDPPPPPPEPPKRVRHGIGKYIEGRFVYDGEFQEDAVSGFGKFSYPSGACYEGQWLNGLYNGNGKYSWPDGRSYEGAWVDNKMHGHGVFTDASGHKWEGDFHNGSGPGLTCDLR